LDYIRELTDVEVFQSLENLLNIEKRQRAVDVNLAALAASAGAGNRDAVNKVNELVNEIKDEDKLEDSREKFKGVGRMEAPRLTAEQLANLKFGG
jgi:hypothetical protein